MSQILNTCITTKFRVCRVCTKYIILMYAIYQTIASDLILSLNIFEGVLKRDGLLFGSKYIIPNVFNISNNFSDLILSLNIFEGVLKREISIPFYLVFVHCPLYRRSLIVKYIFCDTQIFLQFLQEIFAHFRNILLSNIPKHCDIILESTSVLP